MKLFLSLLCCLVLVGCSSPMASMNKRMAYADSGATLATAVAIDQIPADKFDAKKAEIVSACEQVKAFLKDGRLVDLPLEKVKKEVVTFMVNKGLQAYVSLVDIVFVWVEAQKVDTQKIGADNLVVIGEGLDGIIRQATRAKKDWAKPIGTARLDTTRGKNVELK
jgi:hypothetical protein